MPNATWSVQDAKNRFSAVVEAAQQAPQTVTKHGRPAAVIMSADEYERLRRLERQHMPSFAEMLLAIPKDENENEEDIFERVQLKPRDVEF